jgi:uncharacterized protein with ParB-like and HNH nuclease domain
MRADALPIGAVLGEKRRFEVPIYQRTYAWTEGKQLPRFFEHIALKARAMLNGGRSDLAHYMGALIVQPEGGFSIGRVPTFLVIDGQQRLTTFQVFLASLREIARERGLEVIGSQLLTYVRNEGEHLMADPGKERYKLQPTGFDRALFRDLIDRPLPDIRKRYPDYYYQNGSLYKGRAHLLVRAFHFFRDEISKFVDEDGKNPATGAQRLEALYRTLLEDFRLVVITLDEKDDAQVIFETLNATGEPLTAMDLVRNDIFYRGARSQNADDAEKQLAERWSVFEQDFWKQVDTQGRIKKQRMDFFLSHTLSAETGRETLLSELYAEYRRFSRESSFANVAAELATLTRYAPTYRSLAAPAGDGPLARLARRLEVWDVSTAYPLVFVIEAQETASIETKAALYDLIHSYIVRRAICGLTPKNYNNTFLRVASHLRKTGVSVDAFAEAFVNQTGDTVRFPDDQEVQSSIRTRTLYGNIASRRLASLLGELELAARDQFDENVSLPDGLTVEHILPNSWMENWPLADGMKAPIDWSGAMPETMRTAITEREQIKHTLGNLTLLTPAANPSYSNGPFSGETGKRDRLRNSLLKLNQEIAANDSWDETRIRTRADRLAALATAIWPAPTLPMIDSPTAIR